MPEVPSGLWMPLCKQTLKVGPGAWGLQRCGPDIAGDSGLRHAVAGAPCKRHDRQPLLTLSPRPRTNLCYPRTSPGSDLPLASSSLGTPCLVVRGRPWRLLGEGGAYRVGVRSVSGPGGDGGLDTVNHPRMTAGAVS